jgi:hypothetical protein
MLVIFMRIRIWILPFTFVRDPDLDPSFQIKAQNHEKTEKGSSRLIFHTFWLVICKLSADMNPVPDCHFYADPDPAYHFDVDPDADPKNSMIWIQPFTFDLSFSLFRDKTALLAWFTRYRSQIFRKIIFFKVRTASIYDLILTKFINYFFRQRSGIENPDPFRTHDRPVPKYRKN